MTVRAKRIPGIGAGGSSRGRASLPVLIIYVVIILMAIYASLLSRNFLTPANLLNVARQAVPLSLVAIGQTLVILTGGIDFSVGAVAGLVGIVAAVMFAASPDLVIPVSILCVILGAAIGLCSGLLVTLVGANPFVATLGVSSIVSGVMLTITTGPIGGAPESLLGVYAAAVGGVPVVVIALAIAWLAAWVVLTRMPFGRHLYGVGGSTDSARTAGIRVERTVIFAYIASGFLAATTGLFLLARSGIGDPSFGRGLDFLSVTAVALGGVSLYGGRGSLFGTLGGVLLLTLLTNVFNLTQVDSFYQQLLTGVIVLFAVAAVKTRKE